MNNSYVLKILTQNHSQEILSLNKQISDNPQTKQFLSPLRVEVLNYCLSEFGFSLGVFSNCCLIGYRLVYFPKHETDIFLNFDADLKVKMDISINNLGLHQLARFAGTAVHKDYRQQGLANQLITKAMKMIKKREYRWILVTCHPQNKTSLHILEKFGFYPIGAIEKDSDRYRTILLCNLDNLAKISMR